MPVVPFSGSGRSGDVPKAAPSRPLPDEPYVLMAAAAMHADGRLVEPPKKESAR